MSKAWRVVGIVVLVLIVAGIVAGAIGMLTGASLDRMVENVFGGWESLEIIVNALMQELGRYFPGLGGVAFTFVG